MAKAKEQEVNNDMMQAFQTWLAQQNGNTTQTAAAQTEVIPTIEGRFLPEGCYHEQIDGKDIVTLKFELNRGADGKIAGHRGSDGKGAYLVIATASIQSLPIVLDNKVLTFGGWLGFKQFTKVK